MTKLSTLHSQLAALQRARTGVRWGAGYAALAVAVLWLLVGVLVLDLIFEMSVTQRIVMLVLATIGVVWAFARYTRPFLGVRETELDMALLVEKQQQIDSDLVAALQFEASGPRSGGSQQLKGAVIDYVADLGSGLNVFEGFSRRQLTSRATAFSVTAAALLIAAALFPAYARVFFDRLLLGNLHYPSDTQIDQVMVNFQHVLSASRNGTSPDSIKSAQSRPVQFLVRCTGDLPPAGTVKLKNVASGQTRKLELNRLSLDERLARLRQAETSLQTALDNEEQSVGGNWRNENLMLLKLDAPNAAKLLLEADLDRSKLAEARRELADIITAWPAASERSAIYLCELGRMIDSINYKISLGDAWTDPANVEMIPLPTIELRLKVDPPKYAAQQDVAHDPGARQLSVLEGSSVGVAIECTNRKSLAEAWLIARSKEETTKFDLKKDDKSPFVWRLPIDNTPFQRVASEVRFELQVADEDHLQLESPIQGVIRIKADRPPTGSADVVHRVVLPSAKPVIEYRVHDDYGVGEVTLLMQVERAEAASPATPLTSDDVSSPEPKEPVAAKPEEKVAVTLRKPTPLLLADQLPHVAKHEVSLSELKLVKGDRLKLTLDIRDYRGDLPGEAYLSEPLYLEISDEDGVFSAILEADKKADQRLSDIIKRQLGIGESP